MASFQDKLPDSSRTLYYIITVYITGDSKSYHNGSVSEALFSNLSLPTVCLQYTSLENVESLVSIVLWNSKIRNRCIPLPACGKFFDVHPNFINLPRI